MLELSRKKARRPFARVALNGARWIPYVLTVLHDIYIIMILLQKWTSPIFVKGWHEYLIMKLQFFMISLTRPGASEPCVITVKGETNFLTCETRLSSPGVFQAVVCLHRPR